MKTPLALLALVAAQLSAFAADDLPKPQAFARYEGMTSRSPFAVATAATPPPQAPNFAKDLYIANAAKLSDEGVVTLASNVDKNMKEYLTTKGPNKNGYSISNIEWSDRVGATKVTIAKDGQFATLTFNQALLSQPVANAPTAQPPQVQPAQITGAAPGVAIPNAVPTPITTHPVSGVPQANPNPANQIKPAPVPMLPTPPPRVRGVIQRNPNGVGTPVPDDRAQLQNDQQ